MSVQVRWNKDGSLASRFWYACFQVKGHRRVVSTQVEVAGAPGSKEFEQSKGRALAEHDRIIEEAQKKSGAEKLIERLVEIKTGDPMKSTPLDHVSASWGTIPRKRKPSKYYLERSTLILSRFVAFLKSKYPQVADLADVTAAQARSFLTAEEQRGVAPRTWNQCKGILRSLFHHLEPGADAYRNLLAKMPDRHEDSIHRQPFTADEITAILGASRNDELMRPLIVTALCTAMRRGDCALLQWSSVDLKTGFITVKTSKTGETVEIPIMPLLREELCALTPGGSNYVFPKAAAIYQQNADGLNLRLREILAQCGFVDPKIAPTKAAQISSPVRPTASMREEIISAISNATIANDKKQRMLLVFDAYLEGATVPNIAHKFKMGKGSVSAYLNQAEKLSGKSIIRRKTADAPPTIRGHLFSEGTGPRLKRGSLRGWHSFRTTFITLALSAGLPMELVRRVTGHTTVDVVLKHYFRPGREDFRRAMQAAMPKMLTMGEKSPKEEALAIIDTLSARTIKQQKARLRELVESL